MHLPDIDGLRQGEEWMYNKAVLLGEGTSGCVYPGGSYQDLLQGRPQFAVKVCSVMFQR